MKCDCCNGKGTQVRAEPRTLKRITVTCGWCGGSGETSVSYREQVRKALDERYERERAQHEAIAADEERWRERSAKRGLLHYTGD